MMKRISVLIIPLLVVAIFAAGCTQPASRKVSSLEDVKAVGKFVVGLDDGFAPMGFRDQDGDLVGFDIDMANEVAKRLGVDVEFVSIDWDSKEFELESGNIDMIWNGLTITEKRKKQMAFTEPYLDNTQIIVVLIDSDIKGKADLAGKKVGLQTESSAKEAVMADKEIYESLDEMVEYPGNFEALQDLKTGRIDAVVVDEILGKYYFTKNPGIYKVLKDNFGTEEYGIGMRLEAKDLVEEFNKILNELKEDGTMSQISIKWFGEDIVK